MTFVIKEGVKKGDLKEFILANVPKKGIDVWELLHKARRYGTEGESKGKETLLSAYNSSLSELKKSGKVRLEEYKSGGKATYRVIKS